MNVIAKEDLAEITAIKTRGIYVSVIDNGESPEQTEDRVIDALKSAKFEAFGVKTQSDKPGMNADCAEKLMAGLVQTVRERNLRIVSVHGHIEGDMFAMRILDDQGNWYAKGSSLGISATS